MFTQQVDKKLKFTILVGVSVLGIVGLSAYFGLHPRVSDVGYRPEQPIAFSHKLHAGQLEVKCLYCHSKGERSAHSTVPPTSTCMNCHRAVMTNSPKLPLLRESDEKNIPIQWRRIHKLPDFVKFNHSRHIRAMIDCASCHGEVETMGVVTQVKPLNMGWCLDCHRDPQKFIVPARPISGIFTGGEDYKAVPPPLEGENRWLASKDGAFSAVTAYQQDEVAFKKAEDIYKLTGLISPKHPTFGPENCASCHY